MHANPLYLVVLIPLGFFLFFLTKVILLGYELKSFAHRNIPSYQGIYEGIIQEKKRQINIVMGMFVVVVIGIEILIRLTHRHRNIWVFGIHLLFAVAALTCFLFARYKYSGIKDPKKHRLLVWSCLASLSVSAILGFWLMIHM